MLFCSSVLVHRGGIRLNPLYHGILETCLAGDRVVRKYRLLLAILGAVVGDGETEACGGSRSVLVVEPDRIALSPDLQHLGTECRFHPGLRVELDPVRSEPHHQPLAHATGSAALLRRRRGENREHIESAVH